MILSKDFFNVCRTAIEQCSWKGTAANLKRVYLALRELEMLQEHNSAARERTELQGPYNSESGDIEYHETEPSLSAEELPDDLDGIDLDEDEQENI